ncbi:hypothetical protein FRB94_012305 [Tulasnella sp. JGI-2019a]|nr:hypothetical protein FRB94_012305 [Tulasnella sp. JGI-2019a]KAG8997308.1 hypothetical protein FRB93_000441 [Tulasnella sp. JGI-2019a]KAG9028219.1 hypothetical protein FRB95_006754 [Tulasnella sp. JGI-2019a]
MYSLVYTSKIVGVTGVGILTTFGFCISAMIIPGVFATDLPASKLLQIWDETHRRGFTFAGASLVTSASAFLFAAYLQRDHPSLPLTVLGITEATHLALAGATVLGGAVFTLIALIPGIKSLEARHAAVEKAKAKGLEPEIDRKGVMSEMKTLSMGNSVRTGIFAISFLLGVSAL